MLRFLLPPAHPAPISAPGRLSFVLNSVSSQDMCVSLPEGHNPVRLGWVGCDAHRLSRAWSSCWSWGSAKWMVHRLASRWPWMALWAVLSSVASCCAQLRHYSLGLSF